MLESVGIEVFLAIGNQILKDGRVYLHGMPDLIVWDSVNLKVVLLTIIAFNSMLGDLLSFLWLVQVCWSKRTKW